MPLVVLALADTAANVTAGATVGLAVFALLALASLSDARKTRHGHIVADLARRWDDPQVLDSVKQGREFDSVRKIELIQRLFGDHEHRETNPAVWLKLYEVWLTLCIYPNVIDTIGVFIDRDIISGKGGVQDVGRADHCRLARMAPSRRRTAAMYGARPR
jgi:hypothetical protein